MALSSRPKNRVCRINKRRQTNRAIINNYDLLEMRRLLAWSSVFDGGSSTLTLTQTVDDGNVIIDNNGAGSAFRALDGSGTTEFVAATNVVVSLLDSTGNQLDVDLDNVHTGNVELNAGDGVRSVELIGSLNRIGGNLSITAGTGDQDVDVAASSEFVAVGSVSFDFGAGADELRQTAGDFSIGLDLNLTGVNRFVFGNVLTVGGNMTMDTTGEAEDSTIQEIGAGGSTVAGNFTYTGGSEVDDVFMNDVQIGGNAIIHLGDGITGGTDDQDVEFFGGGSVGGTFTITSGDSTNGDSVSFFAGSTFDGDVDIDLGIGTNTVRLLGTFNGDNVTYSGDSGTDDVTYGFTGNPASVNVDLGSGNDPFTLNVGASIAQTTLTVDFGDDATDVFTNNYGEFDFNAQLTGLQGFDYDYDSTTDTLTATDVSNSAAVAFDNNGTANAIRFNNGAIALMPAANLNVTMRDGTNAALNIDYDSAFAGNLMVDLGDGARALSFVGDNNSIGGDLSITAGDDVQTVEVAVNATFSVGGNAWFDLGTGNDSVDEDFNDINVANDLTFLNVNVFENNGTMIVGGNVLVDVSGETENTKFDDDATMTFAGNFTFIGGDGRDEVTLNGAGGTSIGGNAVIEMGDNTVGGTQSIFFNSALASVGGNLTVTSTSATTLDDYLSDTAASFGGDVSIDLGGGPNSALIRGVLNGNSVDYRGGSGLDNVTFAMTGNAANVDLRLGAGDDNFQINAGTTAVSLLRVDFGGGNDTLDNNFGDFTFAAALRNWHDFNRFFSPTLNQWNIVQNADVGDVSLSIDVSGNVQLNNGFTSTMPPADNVRLTLLNDTGNVNVGIESALPGFLFLTVGQGDRQIAFDGANNTINGFLRIEAASGEQSVELAATSDLLVTGSTIINLRDGFDTVTHTNNLIIGNLIFRGVNDYENKTSALVNGNFVINTTFEVEDSRIDNDGTMAVVGKLIYIGGDGQDDIILNDGVNVGEAYLDVGTGTGFPNQTIDLSGNFESAGRVYVFGGDSFGGNLLKMDSTSLVNGDLVVDFSASVSSNQAIIDGVITGNYGVYRGGTGSDTVSMDAVAVDMDFILKLGDDEDTFNLLNGADVLFMYADFGDGTDTFNDDFDGVYPFGMVTKRLP